jgi:precorrin-6A synthase|tara:strand:+ start:14727 stop:15506 length:780 start_codon:yes stop_codon:yes gene_type:complete
VSITLYLIGIGFGNEKHVTEEAANTIKNCDLILIGKKKEEKSDIADLKRYICNSFVKINTVNFQEFIIPERQSSSEKYINSVLEWHDKIAKTWAEIINAYTSKTEKMTLNVGIPIWGDPSLYDSSQRIALRVRNTLPNTSIKLIPGLSSIQLLVSAFGMPFNEIGKSVLITTGRLLKENGWPDGAETIYVVLDGECSFKFLKGTNIHIWWAAYLGMKEQTLIQGDVQKIGEEIIDTRNTLRSAKGWILDIYKLQRVKGN